MQSKAFLFLVFFSVTAALPAFSSPKTDFDAIVDFSIKLSDLDHFYKSHPGTEIQTDKIVILNGAIASLDVKNPKEESFLAEFELINGKWLDVSTVESYFCVVQLKDPSFAKRIPSRRSRNKPENAIEPNEHVLVVGRIIGTRIVSESKTVPVLEAFYVREIE